MPKVKIQIRLKVAHIYAEILPEREEITKDAVKAYLESIDHLTLMVAVNFEVAAKTKKPHYQGFIEFITETDILPLRAQFTKDMKAIGLSGKKNQYCLSEKRKDAMEAYTCKDVRDSSHILYRKGITEAEVIELGAKWEKGKVRKVPPLSFSESIIKLECDRIRSEYIHWDPKKHRYNEADLIMRITGHFSDRFKPFQINAVVGILNSIERNLYGYERQHELYHRVLMARGDIRTN